MEWFVVLLVLLVMFWMGHRFLQRCDRASQIDWGNRWLNRVDGLSRMLSYRYHRLECDHIPLPATGPAVLVANHVSGLDPLLLIAAVNRPLRFLIAQEEYERFGLTWLFRLAGCIPVDREKNPERAMRLAQEALVKGEVVAVFPHGSIQLPGVPGKKIKGGAVRLARRQRCNIYPAYIEGIKGHGMTLMAVPLRSRARIRALPVMDCSVCDYEQAVEHLNQLLNTPPSEGENISHD
ncbi:MAG: 1-acyl-sn-glycerol-3-phosphate acyltransferase [Gammaproteobacteria bacterium]|nr:1-acyl-sn-glycerol-3-phosphate acyltransferase [Gammaproteobacteria bacterium]